MIGIVWYCYKENGKERLEKVIEDYKRMGIEVAHAIRSHNETEILFENKDVWRMVRGSDSQRGRCCNVSLIERSIPIDIYECVIRPCTKALPYQAIGFYGE